MENNQRDVILILGKTGSGKTTWAANYIKGHSRVLIADAQKYREFNARDFESFESLAAYLETSSVQANFFRVSYSPYYSEYPLMFDLARICKPVHLVLEEADRFDDPRFFPEYEEVIARGRHEGVSVVALSRYPFALPSMLRREATRIIAFHHHEPSDLSWFSDVIGADADLLPTLKEHEYLDWSPELTGKLEPKKLCLTPARAGLVA